MATKMEPEQLIIVGIPLFITLGSMIFGYMKDSTPFIILGWGSAFLTVLLTYLEIKFSKYSFGHRYKILSKKGDAFLPVIAFLNTAKVGDELFAIATVPASEEYEKLLVKKVLELCGASNNNSIIFTRIITNIKNPIMKTLI